MGSSFKKLILYHVTANLQHLFLERRTDFPQIFKRKSVQYLFPLTNSFKVNKYAVLSLPAAGRPRSS